jgi:MFS family permease
MIAVQPDPNSVTAHVGGSTPATLLARWGALAILVFFFALSYLDRSLLHLLVNPIEASLRVTDTQMGFLQGFSFSILYALVALPMGWAADRYSRRWIVFWGVAVWSVSTVFSGFSRGFPGLALGRAGVGAGEATLSPAAFSLLADLFPKSQLATALGIYYFGAQIGQSMSLVLGGLIVGWSNQLGGSDLPLVGALESWRLPFVLIGLPGVLFALLAFAVRERRSSPPRHAGRWQANTGWSEFFSFMWTRRPLVSCHFFGFALIGFCSLAIQGWVPAYMGRHFGWDTQTIGTTVFIAVLLAGTFNIVLGRVSDILFRRGMRDSFFRVHAVATLIGLPFIVGSFFLHNPLAFIVVIYLGAAMLHMGGSATGSLQIMAPPRMRGKLSACYLLVVALVSTGLGPFVPGLITDALFHDRSMLGYSIMIAVGVAAPLAVLLLALGAKPFRQAVAAIEPEVSPCVLSRT